MQLQLRWYYEDTDNKITSKTTVTSSSNHTLKAKWVKQSDRYYLCEQSDGTTLNNGNNSTCIYTETSSPYIVYSCPSGYTPTTTSTTSFTCSRTVTTTTTRSRCSKEIVYYSCTGKTNFFEYTWGDCWITDKDLDCWADSSFGTNCKGCVQYHNAGTENVSSTTTDTTISTGTTYYMCNEGYTPTESSAVPHTCTKSTISTNIKYSCDNGTNPISYEDFEYKYACIYSSIN